MIDQGVLYRSSQPVSQGSANITAKSAETIREGDKEGGMSSVLNGCEEKYRNRAVSYIVDMVFRGTCPVV